MLINFDRYYGRKRVAIVVGFGILALAQASLAVSTPSKNGDWPQWLGPHRDGLSTETGILKSWPAAGPEEVWRTTVDDGYSAIAIANGRLYTMYATGGEELLVCLDSQSGKEHWRYATDGSIWADQFGNGPRSTPTVDEGLVFALGAKAKLHAVDGVSGKKLWSKDLKSEYGAKIPTWGVSSSPLVYEDLLIVDVGGNDANGLVAFEKKTGKIRWTSRTSLPGYSAPIAVTVGGVRQILAFTGTALVSVSPEDGSQYWSYTWRTEYDVNAATPIFIAPDRVFISSGYGKGGAVLKISSSGQKANVEEAWKNREMRNHFGTSVLVGDHLYGFDEANLKCLNVNTQETTWAQRGLGKGSLIYADGHLIVFSEKGKLVLIEASTTGYVEKASAQILTGRCWTVPTLANGKLYLRNQKELVCLDFSAGSSL